MVMILASLSRLFRRRSERAQLETLDLPGGGLGELVDELDPARVFIARKPRLHMLLQGVRERPVRPDARLQHNIGARLYEFLLVGVTDDRGLEHGLMAHQRGFDL